MQLLGVPVQAFIVTKKAENADEVLGVPIIDLKEFETRKGKVGVIVALKRRYRDEVVPVLIEKGYNNITFFPN